MWRDTEAERYLSINRHAYRPISGLRFNEDISLAASTSMKRRRQPPQRDHRFTITTTQRSGFISVVHPQLGKNIRLHPWSRSRNPSCYKGSRIPRCGDLLQLDPSHLVRDTHWSVRLRRWPACINSPTGDSVCCSWRNCYVGG